MDETAIEKYSEGGKQGVSDSIEGVSVGKETIRKEVQFR